jgi:hypothetical protein
MARFALGRDSDISPKRRISIINRRADQIPVQSQELVKLRKRGRCVNCKGLRYGDWPKKRRALNEIPANKGRESITHDSIYGCRQCDVQLCNNKAFFEVFHRE